MRQFNVQEVVIRNANKSDAKALIDYVNTISGESEFLTFGVGEFNMTVEDEEDYLNNFSKQKNGLYLIAEIDGKIVGSLNFSGGTKRRTAHTGELGVSVLKEYWRQGIGTELINSLIKWSKDSGIIRKLNLRVASNNTQAIKLYTKLGFIKEGFVTRELLINNIFHDCILMGMIID